MLINGNRTDSVLIHGRTVVRDPDTKLWKSGGALRQLGENYVHACVTDPPYGISFAGKDWDTFESLEEFRQFTQAWAQAVFHILKPGGAAFVCCGQKSFARDFEAVGFIHRTSFMWYFGTGMPTFAGGPQSAFEVIIGMVKPGEHPVDTNVETIGSAETADECEAAARRCLQEDPLAASVTVVDADGEHVLGYRKAGAREDGLYVPKVTPKERDFGCEDLPLREKARGTKARNPHPTTKPLKLMKILVRRACPPGGIVLDCFMGSGTTGMACAYTGRQFIGIERSPCREEPADYMAIAMRRIAKALGGKQRVFPAYKKR